MERCHLGGELGNLEKGEPVGASCPVSLSHPLQNLHLGLRGFSAPILLVFRWPGSGHMQVGHRRGPCSTGVPGFAPTLKQPSRSCPSRSASLSGGALATAGMSSFEPALLPRRLPAGLEVGLSPGSPRCPPPDTEGIRLPSLRLLGQAHFQAPARAAARYTAAGMGGHAALQSREGPQVL